MLKILLKLMKTLMGVNQNKAFQLQDFLDFDIEQLHKEIQDSIKALNAQSQQDSQVKKENAGSLFDDFYGGNFSMGNTMGNTKQN